MRNKSKNMYGRLAAILLTVVLLTAGLSCTALAAGGNILSTIDGVDPTFESNPVANTEWGLISTAELVDGGREGSTVKSVEMTEKGEGVYFMVPSEPNKNYTLSFWMRNSKDNVLQLKGGNGLTALYAPRIGRPRDQMTNGGTDDWDWMDRKKNVYFGSFLNDISELKANEVDPYLFGIARDEEASKAWRQVSINFSSGPEDTNYVKLALVCLVQDPQLAVDDFSVVETGLEPSFVRNGNMEALRYDGDAPELTALSYIKNQNFDTNIVTENDNTYLTVRYIGPRDTGRDNWQVASRDAIFTLGKRAGTRYKISYRAKAEGASSTPIGINNIELREISNSNNTNYAFGGLTDDWRTYTMYLDATKLAAKTKSITDFNTYFVRYAYNTYTLCIDDIVAWYDKTNIGFYESLDLKFENENDRYYNFRDYADAEYQDIIMLESSKKATSISDLPADPGTGERTVTVRAHYLPEANWESNAWEETNVSFEETNVTLLSAVYTYEKDERGRDIKKLVHVDAQTGTSSDKGETIDVVTQNIVPAGDNYWVEAMAWDMNGMKPIMEKTELR